MFNKRGTVLNFCQGIASGLAHLHRRDYAVPDLAARCVQVTAAMSVKVNFITQICIDLYCRAAAIIPASDRTRTVGAKTSTGTA